MCWCGVNIFDTAVPMFPSNKGKILWTNGMAARTTLTVRSNLEGRPLAGVVLAKASSGGCAALRRRESPSDAGRGDGSRIPLERGGSISGGSDSPRFGIRRPSSLDPFTRTPFSTLMPSIFLDSIRELDTAGIHRTGHAGCFWEDAGRGESSIHLTDWRRIGCGSM